MSSLIVLALAIFGTANAGERVFAFSYGYGTVPKGGVEVEHYGTAYGKNGGDDIFWEHQIELEYGITDRLEAGLYVVGGQWNDEPMAFRAYKGRLRYRFGSEGVAPIDSGIYFEYIGSPTFDSHGVEAKVLLAKHVGKFTSALNVEYEVEFEADGSVVQELEPTLGAGVYLTPGVVVGAEGMVETYFREDGIRGPFAWAGPSVHLSGEGGKLWWTLSALFPVTGTTMEQQGMVGRSLIAINL